MNSAWLFLVFAGLLEIAWAIGLKLSNGFTRPWPSAVAVGGIILSIVFLTRALRVIPLGTGYAVWNGIGAFGTAIVGLVAFNEPRDLARLASLGLVAAGLVCLKLTSHA